MMVPMPELMTDRIALPFRKLPIVDGDDGPILTAMIASNSAAGDPMILRQGHVHPMAAVGHGRHADGLLGTVQVTL
jgi:hypothetical protein